MKARVTASALRRLEALARPRDLNRKGGYLVLPPILDLDDWEARAMQHQRALLRSHGDDRQAREHDEAREVHMTPVGVGQSRWAP